jgi:hypothetical protein
MSRVRIIGSAIALLLIGSAAAKAASLVDPRLGFRVLPTEHFVIYFHQGEIGQARRLTVIAEEVWDQLSAVFPGPMPRRRR